MYYPTLQNELQKYMYMNNHVHRALLRKKKERSIKETEYRKDFAHIHIYTHIHTYIHTYQLQQLRKIYIFNLLKISASIDVHVM